MNQSIQLSIAFGLKLKSFASTYGSMNLAQILDAIKNLESG